ncbi:hypothetical protein PpBr36_05372 [Pyricularia pennisetigena]|uniref:hypothetical protein n=1 Tax=Pyricularia pennisetigena TaxID=1578925 RepID=UPI001153270D|nr:hypothetical protein PpBr36_05372 [Pyricularia pennisetigena]TLS27149.1 hypothetical protein PpBr36_05372 [Pyricularia pennisetigena]
MESSKPAATPSQDAAAPSEGSQPRQIDDLSLQWDQTYLRLNYILGNLGGPVAAAGADNNNSSSSSASARTGAEGCAEAAGAPSSATPGRRNSVGNRAGDKANSSAVPNFPGLSRPDAARKVSQIATWCDEVVSQAGAGVCSCSLGSSAAISAADDTQSCSLTKGLLPAAFVAGSLASPAVRSRRKPSFVATAAAAPAGRGEDGGGPRSSSSSGSSSSSSSGDDVDSPGDADVCALCCRHGDVRDLVAESWPGDGGAARKAFRRVQLSLLRIGRRRPQLLRRSEEPFPPDADPKPSHSYIQSQNYSAATATPPADSKPAAAVATTSMYHYRTDPDDQDDQDLSSDDSTSTTGSNNNGTQRQKFKPTGSGGASRTLAAREQMERNQRAKDARLRRAQKLLEKSLVVTPKTTGVQS